MRHTYREIQHLQEEPFWACPFQSWMISMALLSPCAIAYIEVFSIRKWRAMDENNHLVLKIIVSFLRTEKLHEGGVKLKGELFFAFSLFPHSLGHKTTKGKFNTFHRFTKTRKYIHSYSCWLNTLIISYLCYVCVPACVCIYIYHMCVNIHRFQERLLESLILKL